MALTHPMAAELRHAGVITAGGDVDGPVREWLAVLARREVAVMLYAQHPGRRPAERVLLAGFANWWAVLERCDDVIRLSGAGEAATGDDVGRIVSAQIERLLGSVPAARIRSATIDVDKLLDCVTDERSLRRHLAGQRLDPEQIEILAMSADTSRCPQTSLVAIHSGVGRPRIDAGVVTIMDSPAGRLLSEHLRRDGRRWMIVGPGSSTAITAAVLTMLLRSGSERSSQSAQGRFVDVHRERLRDSRTWSPEFTAAYADTYVPDTERTHR